MPNYKEVRNLGSAYKRRDSIHGDGIMDDLSNLGKKVIVGVKNTASTVGDYFSRVVNMKKENHDVSNVEEVKYVSIIKRNQNAQNAMKNYVL